MRLEQAREALTARGCSVKIHDDDKPVRGASHKLRAACAGQPVERVTLYFVEERLWQIKLRPGAAARALVEAGLGAPDAEHDDLRLWSRRDALQGIACWSDRCQLLDAGVWKRTGRRPLRAVNTFLDFQAKLDHTARQVQVGVPIEKLRIQVEEREGEGVEVVACEPGTLAAHVFEKGDRILRAEREPIGDAADLQQAIKDVPEGGSIILVIERRGVRRHVVVRLVSPGTVPGVRP